jgi:hypothetical protein
MKRLLAAGCVAVFTLAGCTGGGGSGTVPPPTIERPAAELPKDRDEKAVIATLRRVDMCAVLDAAAAAAGTTGYTLRATSPTVCTMDIPTAGQPRSASLDVGILSSDERLHLPSTTLRGAKAYIETRDDYCRVHFPITFRLAIQIHTDSGPCAYAEKLATGVAAALADPTGVAAEPRWEACELLGLSTDVEPLEVGNLDGCSDSENLATVIELRNPLVFPEHDARRTRIGGVDVWMTNGTAAGSTNCWIDWAPGRGDLVVRLGSTTCATVEPLVERVNRTLHEPPPEVPPQRPLLYPPDEPDRRFAGACAFADMGDASPEVCAPHVEVPAPAGGDSLAAAEADPDVACELALDAVTERFGSQMQAVAVANRTVGCYFVMSERLVQLEFSVASQATFSRLGRHDEREIEVAGHAGSVAHQQSPGEGYRFTVAASTDVDEPGVLRLRLSKGPVVGAALAGDAVDKAEQVLADIVRRHFER